MSDDWAELKKEYMNDLFSRLKLLKKDIDDRNPYGVMYFAHKTKGSGTSYGYPEITKIAMDIENVFKEVDWKKFDRLYKNLEKTVKKFHNKNGS